MASDELKSGTYMGFTHEDLLVELSRYKAEVKAMVGGPRNITSASVNGKSFSYGPNGNLNLAQWQAELQNALSKFDSEFPPMAEEGRACFR